MKKASSTWLGFISEEPLNETNRNGTANNIKILNMR